MGRRRSPAISGLFVQRGNRDISHSLLEEQGWSGGPYPRLMSADVRYVSHLSLADEEPRLGHLLSLSQVSMSAIT